MFNYSLINFDLKTYTNSLLKGNRDKCLELINEYLKSSPSLTTIYEDVIKRSLYEVGELWEQNKIPIAAEHLATSTTEFLLNHMYKSLGRRNKTGKKSIIAGVEQEFHQIGIKMVMETFERYGWESIFLGANVPTKDLILLIKTTNPDLICLSLSIYNNLPDLKKMIIEIRAAYPTLPIIVGGRAFLVGGTDMVNQFRSAFYIADLYMLEIFLESQNQFS